MHTSPFNGDPWYSNGASGALLEASDDTGELVRLATRLAERIWRDGYRYFKAGVLLDDLLPAAIEQPALWTELDRDRRRKLWRVVDQLNADFGRDMVRMAGGGKRDAAWRLRADFRTPRWTTRRDELPLVR